LRIPLRAGSGWFKWTPMPRSIRVGYTVRRHVHGSACVGLLGGARSRSLGTEGAEALPRWDPPASCPRCLSNTTCGAPSSRRARGTARMRVPSSSLTLRSEAPVRTRRGSGFGPLISRAVRGGAWAAPSFRVCGRRGVWASQLSRRWLIAQRGMGACGVRFTSSRPWATLSRACPL
jgi:hypothetical protein